MINTTLDYIPITLMTFINTFLHLFTFTNYSNTQYTCSNYTIYGYSCRSLFHSLMEYFKKDDIVVVTTPIHHTSFRNIIELFVKPENIHIIKMNENYNTIESLPKVNKCDLLIITHLFGQDMQYNKSELEIFKRNTNCIFIEDRVQGGALEKKFSSDIFDISFYSSGMDKRPVALGGGFTVIRDKYKHAKDIYLFLSKSIEQYPQESRCDRFLFLIKKILTYLFYNCKIFFWLVSTIINFFGYSVNKISESYRKNNPGFAHGNYLIKPSNALMKSIIINKNNYVEIEKRYSEKYNMYFKNFPETMIRKYYPWILNNPLLTPYNTVSVKQDYHDIIRNYFLKYGISSIQNPTYKTFNHNYNFKINDETFNNSLIYLPSIANMNYNEMEYMLHVLNILEKKDLIMQCKN